MPLGVSRWAHAEKPDIKGPFEVVKGFTRRAVIGKDFFYNEGIFSPQREE